MAVIDQILRKFFSNFSVKQSGKGKEQRCNITHKLNEPWSGFVKYKNVACGRGERTQTFDLSVPNRARYQLRHTPIGVLEKLYTSFNDLTRGVGRLYIVGQRCRQPQTALRASSCRVSFRRSSRARRFCRLPILVWR